MMRKSMTILLLTLGWSVPVNAEQPNFQDDVLPVFKRHCLSCHNADKHEADLDLSSFAAIQLGSSGGQVVKAGLPDTSPLYMAVNHHEDYSAMPPNKPKIPGADLKRLHGWIAAGLIESRDGKSQLRDVAFQLGAGSSMRPDAPAVPHDLPKIPLTQTKHASPVIAMASSPWADVVAVSGHEQILLFGPSDNPNDRENKDNNSPSYQHIGTLPFSTGAVHDLRFSRNGDLLVAAGGRGAYSGNIVIYDVKTGERQAVIGDEHDIVLSADISSDHKVVAIGTPANVVKIYSTLDGSLLHRIEKHTDWVTVVRFSPDGKMLASADRNGGIHVWETTSAGIVYTLDEHKTKITALDWRSDGKVLASAAEDGRFVLWDMTDGWAIRTTSAHTEKSQTRYSRRTGILDIAFAPDGRLLTAGRDQTVKLFNADASLVRNVNRLESLPLRIAVSVDGNHAWVGDFSGNVYALNLKNPSDPQLLKPQ